MEHFTDQEISCILRQFHRVLKANGKIVFFWPHARASSVLVLRLCHQFLRFAMKSDKKLHPLEISLMRSRKHAREILAKADLELSDYHFGPSDLWVQAVITAHKKSPHLYNKIL